MTCTSAIPLTVLIADDDPSTRRVLETRLAMKGFAVTAVCDGLQAVDAFRLVEPHVVVLDVMMPELDGFGVVERLRAVSDVPIILLTSLGDISARVTGLQLGADDYMVKPFSPKELEARIHCLLRRSHRRDAHSTGGPSSRPGQMITVGELRIDLLRRQVHRAQERIRLTGMEFSLLELLLSRAGEAIPRTEMLEKLWGYTPERLNDRRVVDVHISRLRAKLEIDPEQPELIQTARGMGYLFQRLVPTELSAAC
jgi:two-component system, OmpR family, response regulator RpaB